MKVKVAVIKQLTDNYSYIIYSEDTKQGLVLDPAEPLPILDYIYSNKIKLESILITHHHSDHTQGIKEIKNKFNISVFSSNENIEETTHLVKNNQKINFEFVEFEVIATPGHTIDHIVFFSKKEKILFSGDTLFRYGCGRVFEGTMEQMLNSLNKIKDLPDDTRIYCGHEYTDKNFSFIFNEIIEDPIKNKLKLEYEESILNNGSSMPFYLADEKKWNPFLNCNNTTFKEKAANFTKNQGKISANASELDFFSFIRNKRNAF